MRSIIPFLFLLSGMLSVLMAQTPPQAFKYQAVCRDVNGNPIINQAVKFKIGIVQGSINGNMVYTEYQLDTTNAYGVSNLEIGRGTSLNGTFSNINWANGPYFINLAFDPAGGNAFVSLGVQELLSVPYALYAGSSNTPGPQGPAGPQGVSITNSWVQGDSLFVALSNSQTLNTGHVRGATGANGAQGPAGSSGVSVVNTWVQGDSLFVALSNSQTLNAGHVRGAQGPGSNYSAGTGISIANNVITNTAPDQVVSIQGSGAATVTGTYPNFTVNSSDTTMWRRSTNSIYHLGRVGIGKTNDIGPHILDLGGRYIQLAKDSSGEAGLVKNIPLHTPGYDGSIILGFVANYSTVELHHQLGGYSGGPNASNFYTTFNTSEGGVDAGERMRIAPNGNVGIGTSNPQRDLHINDVMRLQPRNTAPSNPSKGDIYFDNISNKLRVYDGNTWQNCW
jgi:hypothetical protein